MTLFKHTEPPKIMKPMWPISVDERLPEPTQLMQMFLTDMGYCYFNRNKKIFFRILSGRPADIAEMEMGVKVWYTDETPKELARVLDRLQSWTSDAIIPESDIQTLLKLRAE